MKWIIKINDGKSIRILIEYRPLTNDLKFSGEFKIKSEWIVFSEKTCTPDITKFDGIITDIYYDIIDKIDNYNMLNNGFSKMSNISIEVDDDM